MALPSYEELVGSSLPSYEELTALPSYDELVKSDSGESAAFQAADEQQAMEQRAAQGIRETPDPSAVPQTAADLMSGQFTDEQKRAAMARGVKIPTMSEVGVIPKEAIQPVLQYATPVGWSQMASEAIAPGNPAAKAVEGFIDSSSASLASFTTPESISALAIMPESKIGQVLINAGFGVEAARNLPGQIKEYAATDDPKRKGEIFGEIAIGLGFPVAGLTHGVFRKSPTKSDVRPSIETEPKLTTQQEVSAAPIKEAVSESVQAQGQNEPTVTAFHGSPHDFPSFDFARFGNEENRGGSSFGLGLNLTADVGHAKVYSDNGFIYHVELPESAVKSFIKWEAPVSKELAKQVPEPDFTKPIPFGKGATIEEVNGQWRLKADPSHEGFRMSQREVERMFGEANTGEQVYRKLVATLGSESAASKWLMDHGIKGISNNVERGAQNYTVFDPSIAKITKRERLDGKPEQAPSVQTASDAGAPLIPKEPVVRPETPVADVTTETATRQNEPAPTSTIDEPAQTGIAKRYVQEDIDRGALPPEALVSGVGWTPEEAIAKGRELINKGVDPKVVVDAIKGNRRFPAGVKDAGEAVAVLHAERERLAAERSAAQEAAIKNPQNPELARVARAAEASELQFLKEAKPQAGGLAQRIMVAFQEARPVDLSTFDGLYRKAIEHNEGRELLPAQKAELVRRANKAQFARKAESKALDNLQKEIDRTLPGRKVPTEAELTAEVERMVQELTPCR